MVTFTRVIGVGDDSPAFYTFDAPTEQDAMRATLEELQAAVQDHPGVMSAGAIIGEGTGEREAVRWIGGWTWGLGKGYAWSDLD
jgi:hypothetical protein